ncbi:MAG: hypothetical protein F8N15_08675, partial [Methanobacterium sp.]|nr:hypothetical protein [Methanobacterium sp.]
MDIEKDELPEGWAWASLRCLGHWYGGGTPNTETEAFWSGNIPWVSPKDMKTSKIVDAQDHITEEAIRASTTNMVPENSVIAVTRSGILRHTFPVALTERSVAINQDLKALVPYHGLSAAYIAAALRAFEKEVLGECVKHGTTVHSVEFDKLMAFEIPIAPPARHQEIVEKLDELLSEIDEGERGLRKVQALLKKHRQAVLKAAVTGELTRDWRERHGSSTETGAALLTRILAARRAAWEADQKTKAKAAGKALKGEAWKEKYEEPAGPETEGLPALPPEWAWATVGQAMGLFGNGLSLRPNDTPPGNPILRISAVRPMSVDPSDVRYYPYDAERYYVDMNDLLFTRYNGSAHLVGVCGLYREARPVLFPDKLIRARVHSPKLTVPGFLEICMNCGASRGHIASRVKTSAGQQGIAGGDIKIAPFPLPSVDEQRQIIDRVEEEMSKIDAMEAVVAAELRRAGRLRQTILKSAFTGKLVPQNPDDEPADALLARLRTDRAAPPPPKRRGRPPHLAAGAP